MILVFLLILKPLGSYIDHSVFLLLTSGKHLDILKVWTVFVIKIIPVFFMAPYNLPYARHNLDKLQTMLNIILYDTAGKVYARCDNSPYQAMSLS